MSPDTLQKLQSPCRNRCLAFRKVFTLYRTSALGLGLWLSCSIGSMAGCGWPPGYLVSVMGGELDFLSRTTPIETALDDPALTDEERAKLAFLIRGRDYAEQVVGLNVGNNYRTFVNLGGEPLAWNLSASRKDAIEAYYWPLPLIGPIPYLGFFDLDQAFAERDRLVGIGYDTLIYEVETYALWVLPDPVASPMLERDYGYLADVVMHELLHNTVFKLGDTTFSESLAVFVGRTAGVEFLETEFGPDAPVVDEVRGRHEDEDRFNTFLEELIAELNALYASELSPAEKITAREPIFQSARDRFAADILPLMNNPSDYESVTDFPFNNAFLLVNIRYNSDQDVYAGIYEMTGRNWPQALALFAEAADTDDPVQFLRNRLAGGE